MFTQKTQKTVNTPVWAKTIARNALDTAKVNEKVRYDNMIICRMFTAFMVEGVINYLGSVLFKDWFTPVEPEKPNSSLDKQSFGEKHKIIRKKIGMTNDKECFREAASILGNLIDFRHAFAHPKQLKEKIEVPLKEHPKDAIPESPPTHWQVGLNIDNVEKEFLFAEEYCRKILQTASEIIKKNHKEFSHITDIQQSSNDVALFFAILENSRSTIAPVKTAK